MSNQKPVALVTGGGRGIGLGISQSLARDGVDLVVCGMRPEADVEATLDDLRSLGAEVLYCQANVAEADDRQRMIDSIRKHFGRLNILVNNAGVAPTVRLDVLETTEESYERVMKINLQGPFFLTQLVARWMVEQKEVDASFVGSIVNVSSISATVASISRGEYCISKAGVGMTTQLWAVRMSDYDIPVYEVRPGVIKTDMTAAVTDKYDKLLGDGLALQRRWGVPEDVGKVVAMLTRGDCPYSTGQVVMVDGGLTIQRL